MDEMKVFSEEMLEKAKIKGANKKIRALDNIGKAETKQYGYKALNVATSEEAKDVPYATHSARAERAVKRAGLDYWNLVEVIDYENLEDFFAQNPGCNFYCFSTKAPRCYTDVVYETPVFLFFGKETRGLPEDFLREHLDRCGAHRHHHLYFVRCGREGGPYVWQPV